VIVSLAFIILCLRAMNFRDQCDVIERFDFLMLFDKSLMPLYEYDEGFVLYGCL